MNQLERKRKMREFDELCERGLRQLREDIRAIERGEPVGWRRELLDLCLYIAPGFTHKVYFASLRILNWITGRDELDKHGGGEE